MESMIKQSNRITFYIGPEHKDFKEMFQQEIKNLEANKTKYVIFEESNRLLPELCIDGYCVAGLHDIKNELASFLSTK